MNHQEIASRWQNWFSNFPRMETSPDNVIILGAGASADAGIPMLRGFMDTMQELARRGKNREGKVLSSQDVEVLKQGLLARDELDSYHGRVALDLWNIEEILSILAFSDRDRLEAMTKAIAKTIELTCTIRQDWSLDQLTVAQQLYLEFWRLLIDWSSASQRPMPAILTFNYDLVLERSLFNAVNGVYYGRSGQWYYRGMKVDYSADGMGEVEFNASLVKWARHGNGTQLDDVKPQEYANVPTLKVQILKLHGSLNFPKPNSPPDPLMTSTRKLTEALDDPLILPPVFNKATDDIGKSVWANALKILRSCKNLIICGYSLPQTDIYMQYFLKAALGPNKDLSRIYVFDPVLFDAESTKDGDELRQRYSKNFSESIQKRIVYKPKLEGWRKPYGDEGKMSYFVRMLRSQPQSLLIE